MKRKTKNKINHGFASHSGIKLSPKFVEYEKRIEEAKENLNKIKVEMGHAQTHCKHKFFYFSAATPDPLYMCPKCGLVLPLYILEGRSPSSPIPFSYL